MTSNEEIQKLKMLIAELTIENADLKRKVGNQSEDLISEDGTVQALMDENEQLKLENADLRDMLEDDRTAAQLMCDYLEDIASFNANITDFRKPGKNFDFQEGHIGYEIQGYLNHFNDNYGFIPNGSSIFKTEEAYENSRASIEKSLEWRREQRNKQN